MTTNRKFKFTKTALMKLDPPTDRDRTFYYDSEVRGFCLMVRHTGYMSFYLYRTMDYKPERIFIGPFPDLPVEMARKEAEKLNAQIAMGINPQDVRREAKREMTLGELMHEFLERHAKPHKKTWKYDEYSFEKYLSHWRDRRISTITRSEVDALHKKLGADHGIFVANRTVTLLKTMYNKANAWELFTGGNPTLHITQFREKKRDRYVTREEMPKFMKTLMAYPDEDFRDYVLLSLYTGVRQGKILSMRWEDISMDSMNWLIPETKNGKPLLVDLDEVIRPILERRRTKVGPDAEWVFPDPTTKTGYIKRQWFHWKKFLKLTGMKNLKMHDLRHTHATWMVNSGTDLAVVQIALGHDKIETTKGYAHHAPDRTRCERGKAIKAMLEAAGS